MKLYSANKYQYISKTVAFLLVFFSGFVAKAQENKTTQDSIVKGFATQTFELQDPKSLVKAYTYDPITEMYILSKTLGDFPTTYPDVLTPKEYEERLRKESIRKYFKEKLDAIEGKKVEGDEAKKDLLPRYYIRSKLFETIFGSNSIDVRPSGSVELDLGLRYSKQDNPAFSQRNASATSFDFNQRITVGILGKIGTRVNVNINYDTQSTFSFQNLVKISFDPAAIVGEENMKRLGDVQEGIDKVKDLKDGKVPTITGNDDSIIKLFEVGNVALPLNSTLIKGSQSLFGVKTKLQFGKTTITSVFSEQRSETRTVAAEGGGTVQDWEVFAQDYDADRHFFLSQYFRNKYDKALERYPLIDSRVQITRLEVWVTNKQNRVNTSTGNNLRNVIALQDLGEAQVNNIPDNEIVGTNLPDYPNFFNPKNSDSPPHNANNIYDPKKITNFPTYPVAANVGILNTRIREIATADLGFNIPSTPNTIKDKNITEGKDFSKLENARKLIPSEYTFHPQLGYVSLQQRLANDEVLAVAYEYTIGGEVFQVGEFANDGVEATTVTGTTPATQVVSTQCLILKMLKSNLTSVERIISADGAIPKQTVITPVWNLMMKNIYQIPGAFQLKQENFKFNILYTDPSPLNYIEPVAGTTFPANPTQGNKVSQTPLLKVFNLDKLNFNNDPQANGDGFFDYMPGITIDPQNGRIIFTSKEPFGELLFKKLSNGVSENYNDQLSYNPNQQKYVFRNLYALTQAAALQDSEKNKFLLRGKFKSTGGDGIPIGAFNVPRGSVVVTAGGRVLVEGSDYSVNYQLGRVQILDPSLQASNTPINVSVENNATFGQQTKRFFGIDVEHQISEKFKLGATFLKLSERPFTQKSSFGQEAVNNTMFGFNGNFSAEVPFFTRLVNKLPFMDTDVKSNISVRGEIAFLQPNDSQNNKFQGESTIYVDDFEGSQSTIDMRSPQAWELSSTPLNAPKSTYNFNAAANDLSSGFNRAKLAWYTIDPLFYTSKPDGISNDDISNNATRRIYNEELYPLSPIVQGQTQVVNTLDLSYFPTERGPYNNSELIDSNPKENFGGIMRSINSTNFEQGNVEYIQFWVLDPYVGVGKIPNTNTGKIYFNLGEISEDVLKDNRKQYENGLGPDQAKVNPRPVWGDVPASQSLIYAFDVNANNRTNQDVGLDGLPNAKEKEVYTTYASDPDPAADDYKFFLNTTGSILDRYKNYNGLEGNSAIDINNANRASSTEPNVEDVNKDNTMNTINAYYQYEVDVKPNMKVGDKYITDVRESNRTLENGQTTEARWIQFKIPIFNPDDTVGNITDFRSIRFMRLFMTGFSDQITMRFGALDLVRGDWRRYVNSFDTTDANPDDDKTNFDILSVNVQENNARCPINYIVPPGVLQEQLYSSNTVVPQNEQSLALRVAGEGLEAGDSRAVFKNVSVDMRQFNKLKMFLHAESLEKDVELKDNQLKAFIRFGNDFTQNFYQIEIPLKVTVPNGGCSGLGANAVWPSENEIDLALPLLTQLKIKAMSIDPATLPADGIYFQNEADLDPALAGKANKLRIGVKGNPNFGLVRTLMIGVKSNETGLNKVKGEVWFNELRVADMDNKGGMAAVLNVDTNFADFATITASGRKSTIGFGGIEQGPNERSREDTQVYNVVTNFSLGKLLPPKWRINLPFNFAVGEEIITPEYDPFNADIRLNQLLENTADADAKENIRKRAIDYTKRKSINFIGVRKDRGEEQKQRIYDIENFTFSQSFNQVEHHDYEVEQFDNQESSSSVDYTYSFQSKPIEPFKKTKFMKKSNYWKALSDFNFNYLPSSINFNTNIIRSYNKQQFRQVEVLGLELDPLYRRNYAFNYNYGFKYNLTKNLKFTYTAAANNIVKNYLDENNVSNDELTIWDSYFNIGQSNQHKQQLVMNYELPFDKIPLLNFIKSDYTYTGDFNWQRASVALNTVERGGINYDLGNTIQNAISHALNANLTMDTFYKYIGLTKKTDGKAKPKTKPTIPKPGEKITNTNNATTPKKNTFLNGFIDLLTCVKTIQGNYTKNSGTVLPGFTQGIGFFGTSRPSLGFVLGSQDDIRYQAAKNGWLTADPEFNQNFTQVTNDVLKGTVNVDLFPDFKIDLTFDRNYSKNSSEQYNVTDSNNDGRVDFYNPQSPYSYGMFSVSTLLVKTAFSQSDELVSETFDAFKNNRLIVADRLAAQHYAGVTIPRYGDSNNPIPVDVTDPNYKIYTSNQGYPLGFGKNSQKVLLPSFLAAYSGGDASKASLGIFRNIPLPNWSIKYNGLMKFDFFKNNFKRFSLQQNYRASYTINNFRSNFNYDKTPTGKDESGNFFNQTIMSNVNLVEQFSPLVRMDFELKNDLKVLAEVKTDRALSMSFDNNLLTEVKGVEYVVGLGARIKDVVISSKLADSQTGIVKSDIIIKADFSYRKNKTIVRYLDYDNNQIGGGQDIWTLKVTADYSFSKNLTALFYYDHSFTGAVISTSFPLTNLRSGFTIRYNFGN